MVKMWNPTAETMSRDEYAKVQLEGLKKSLARVGGMSSIGRVCRLAAWPLQRT